jgi:hypothetical protein
MRSRSARIIPRLQAELDLASVCVVTLVRGLGLLRPGTRSDNHARIASGSYRLLPYTLEFWIEHCFLYTSEGGALGLNCSLMRHLTRLSDAHRLLSTSLNCPGNDETPADDELGQQAEKLQPFSHLPAHGLMKEVLRTRRLAIERGCETGQGKCRFISCFHSSRLCQSFASCTSNLPIGRTTRTCFPKREVRRMDRL